MTDYSNGTHKVVWETGRFIRIYLAYFTTSNKPRLDRCLCDTLLPYISLCIIRTQFKNNVIKTLLDIGKETICAHNWMNQSPTSISESWTLLTPRFQTCSTHNYWIQYWYAQGDKKTGRFTAVDWPTSLWQPNQKTSGLLVLTSYQKLDMFAM